GTTEHVCRRRPQPAAGEPTLPETKVTPLTMQAMPPTYGIRRAQRPGTCAVPARGSGPGDTSQPTRDAPMDFEIDAGLGYDYGCETNTGFYDLMYGQYAF